MKIQPCPDFTEKAHAMQIRLSKQVVREDCLSKTVQYVAGVDVAYTGEKSIGTVVILDLITLSTMDFAVAHVKTRFPYISTLLSLRELSPTISAIRKLKMQPDVFLVDGQGIAHPYRFGFASQLGFVLNKPSIGVAKSLLCGKVARFNSEGIAPIIDKEETIGMAVTTAPTKKPLYVSIGHRLSLKRSVQIVKQCVKNYRIPEPIRRAHIIANREKKQYSTCNSNYEKSVRKNA